MCSFSLLYSWSIHSPYFSSMTLVLKNKALAGSPQQNQHHDTILAKCHSQMAFTTNELFWNLKSGGVVALGLPHSGAHLRSFFRVFVKALGTKIHGMGPNFRPAPVLNVALFPHGLFAVWDRIWEAILGITHDMSQPGAKKPFVLRTLLEHHLLKCTWLHWRSSGTPFNTLLLLGAALFLVTCSSLYRLSVPKNLKLIAIERHDFLWSVDEDLKPTYILYHVH